MNDSILKLLEEMAAEVRMLRHGGQVRLLSLDAAAAVLGVSERTLRRYIGSGWLRVVNLPAGAGDRCLLRIDRADLDAFVESRKGTAQPINGTAIKEPVYAVPRSPRSRK